MILLLLVAVLAFVVGLVVGIEATRAQVLAAMREATDARAAADQAAQLELIRTVERVTRGR